MNQPNPKVDFFFAKSKSWGPELALLRQIALSTGLTEVLKWGCPCYVDHGTNITLIHAFNDYCALLFFKGALLADPENILVQQTENVQAARQIRFTSANQISRMEPVIRSTIAAAIAVEKAGLKVEMTLSRDLSFPQELIDRFDADPDLKVAFDALTPGRQRAWNLQFTGAKLAATRIARIDKALPKIRAGKGPDDP
jgi:uncharacterized protein YdeI (YjbR/CyaY-like superfamily)